MRYGIFSDIHSNLEAFNKAIYSLKKQNIDKLICLGDIVGYGANPKECLEIISKLKPEVIAGNHDWANVDKFNLGFFNWHAKEAIIWTKRKINKDNWRYLRSLPLMYQENNFCCVHASLDSPREFNYVITAKQAEKNFFLLKAKICFIGHSHFSEAFSFNRGEIKHLLQKKIDIEKNKKYIVNVGSIGQPRDGDPRLSFCIYDTKKKLVEYKRLQYDVKAAADKINKNGLPEFLAQRLYLGR